MNFSDFDDGFGSDRKYRKTVKRTVKKRKTVQQIDNKPILSLQEIEPKTQNQQKAFDYYKKSYNLLLFGSAGSGKSFLALWLSLKSVLSSQSKFEKIIIIRSICPGKDIGFMPGNLAQKGMLFETPYYSICSELFNRNDAYEILKKHGTIEFVTTSFLRGNTFRNSIVILDEFQNSTFEENNAVATRIGENCKFIVCGDTKQNDLINKKYEQSGGDKMINILSNIKSFKCVEFTVDDIVRSGFVKDWLTVKDKLGY